MDILISINPEWVNKIINGKKKHEFRKTKINIDKVDNFYIYSTSPTKKIVASMKIDKILDGTPVEIWEKYAQSESSKESFLEYYGNKTIAYALSIKSVKLLDEPVDPYKVSKNFYPPQSYYYLKDEHLIKALN